MGLRLSVEVYSVIDILSYSSHIEESYMGCCVRAIQSCSSHAVESYEIFGHTGGYCIMDILSCRIYILCHIYYVIQKDIVS